MNWDNYNKLFGLNYGIKIGQVFSLAPTDVLKPVFANAPTYSQEIELDNVLTIDAPTFTPDSTPDTVLIEWTKDGVAIPSTNSTNYTVTGDVMSGVVGFRITATNAAGSTVYTGNTKTNKFKRILEILGDDGVFVDIKNINPVNVAYSSGTTVVSLRNVRGDYTFIQPDNTKHLDILSGALEFDANGFYYCQDPNLLSKFHNSQSYTLMASTNDSINVAAQVLISVSDSSGSSALSLNERLRGADADENSYVYNSLSDYGINGRIPVWQVNKEDYYSYQFMGSQPNTRRGYHTGMGPNLDTVTLGARYTNGVFDGQLFNGIFGFIACGRYLTNYERDVINDVLFDLGYFINPSTPSTNAPTVEIGPYIGGDGVDGTPIKCDLGAYKGFGLDYTISWKRHEIVNGVVQPGVTIVGEILDEYLPLVSDRFKGISCEVIVSNPFGSITVTSEVATIYDSLSDVTNLTFDLIPSTMGYEDNTITPKIDDQAGGYNFRQETLSEQATYVETDKSLLFSSGCFYEGTAALHALMKNLHGPTGGFVFFKYKADFTAVMDLFSSSTQANSSIGSMIRSGQKQVDDRHLLELFLMNGVTSYVDGQLQLNEPNEFHTVGLHSTGNGGVMELYYDGVFVDSLALGSDLSTNDSDYGVERIGSPSVNTFIGNVGRVTGGSSPFASQADVEAAMQRML